MSHSNATSSQTIRRKPYDPIRTLPDAQMGLEEIFDLALMGEIQQTETDRLELIARLAKEIIAVTQATPGGLAKLQKEQ